MYDNGYIVKCRSILTNDICLSEASHKADPEYHPSVQYALAVNQTSERILELVCRKRRKAVWHDESEIHGGS